MDRKNCLLGSPERIQIVFCVCVCFNQQIKGTVFHEEKSTLKAFLFGECALTLMLFLCYWIRKAAISGTLNKDHYQGGRSHCFKALQWRVEFKKSVKLGDSF